MSSDLLILLSTAVSLGVVHTAIGIDHTLPFIVLGKARCWSLAKTLLLTAGCGVAHVLSSVAVGAVGWALGLTSTRLEGFEAGRGNLAAWLLVVFGVVYAGFGLWRLRRGQTHMHLHLHADGTVHSHPHGHQRVDGTLVHAFEHRLAPPPRVVAESLTKEGRLSPLLPAQTFPHRVWPALLLIFFLGPCEALVPLMFGSAVLADSGGAWLVAGAFGAATVGTMLALVWLGRVGLSVRALSKLEPHLNWLAGATIALSGLAVQFGL